MGKPKNFGKSQHHWMAFWRGSIDDTVICPYNPKHVMPYRRLVLHIIPCAQRNSELAAEFVTCPYNSLHRGPKEQLEEHLKDCKEHEMSVFTRVMSGKSPYIKVYEGSANVNAPKDQNKTEQMLQIEADWKEML